MTYSVKRLDLVQDVPMPEELWTVIHNMRAADEAEVWASAHQTPLQAVVESVLASRDTYVGLCDGRAFCLFGVVDRSSLTDNGTPWMLATDEISQHARTFLRHSRTVVGMWREQYSRLENYVDARNTEAVKWLRWLGFTIHPSEPYGIDQLPFHRFSWERANV